MKRQYWIVAVYFVFIVVGIPWYWPDNTTALILGLPIWFVVAIGVSICTSIFTAFLLLRYPWNTDVELDDE
jgi:hypothetical protein